MAGTKKEGGGKRTLVRWSGMCFRSCRSKGGLISYCDADDLDKQLLLCIQYACNEAGLRVPWDNVAKLMGEKFSDGAIVQHLSKLRQKMADNGHEVPPPLKRGTTVVPSKIYATSGTSRRKSMPTTPTTASTVVTTPKPKQSASKKRTRRSGMDSDSDSQPDNMDIADTSDEEYGASGRKKKKQQRSIKSKPAAKQSAGQKQEDKDETKPITPNTAVLSQAVEEERIKGSIETPGPASRTRGVKPDYSTLEQVSEGGDVGAENGKNNGGDSQDELLDDDDDGDDDDGYDDDEATVREEVEDMKAQSDGEVSPRSKVPASPATPTHLMV
jgi:hypothetical protein